MGDKNWERWHLSSWSIVLVVHRRPSVVCVFCVRVGRFFQAVSLSQQQQCRDGRLVFGSRTTSCWFGVGVALRACPVVVTAPFGCDMALKL